MLALSCLGGCRSLGYYAHVTRSHAQLMGQRESIASLIDNDHVAPSVRETLAELLEAREFASARLGLPRNDSYTAYVALPHPYVTWNVFAAPEFSVEPVTQCFLFAGCVAYRGFFDEAKARREAERLQSRDYETYIGGAAAYSTLGWFDDPVLSSMFGPGQDDPVGVVFHELAHQRFYLRNDTAFNESYASFVQRQGLDEWRQARQQAPRDLEAERNERHFSEQALTLRATLADIYRQPIDDDAKRRAKADAIAAFRSWYRQQRETTWRDDARFDRWMQMPINNAQLVPLGLYDRWVPAFAQLFRETGGEWAAFHRRVEDLAALSPQEREGTLNTMLTTAGVDPAVIGNAQ
jgi:predicted aminopeptidase